MKFPINLISNDTKFDFIGKKKIAFFFSACLMIVVLIFFWLKGLNLGIDFTGGLLIETSSSKAVNLKDLRELLIHKGYKGPTLQYVGSNKDILIRIQPKGRQAQDQEIERVKNILYSFFEYKVEFRKVDYVGPKIGKNLAFQGSIATILALICMMIYIWLRFNWQYGVGAILALLHDAFFTLGFYIVSGTEFNLSSIAAILTVIGYSVNDSVVIFDRIRENIRKHKIRDVAKLINLSLNETLSRTIMTSLTTIVVCIALVLFGGNAIYSFSMAILIGVAFGTYSSIYIAAPILLYSNLKKLKS